MKTIGKLVAWSSLVFPFVASAQATCIVNGVEVPCPEGIDRVAGGVAIGFVVFAVIMALVGIAATVFWIMMLVHAATKPVEHKVPWIVLIVLTGIIGAIVYYFVVKRNFSAMTSVSTGSMPPGMPQG